MTGVNPVQDAFDFMPPTDPLPETLNVYGQDPSVPGRSYITIRRGSAWARVSGGHRLTLTEQREGPRSPRFAIGEGVVQAVTRMRFRYIPAEWLRQSHLGRKTYPEMLAVMRSIYGDTFNEDDVVVVLKYKRLT